MRQDEIQTQNGNRCSSSPPLVRNHLPQNCHHANEELDGRRAHKRMSRFVQNPRIKYGFWTHTTGTVALGFPPSLHLQSWTMIQCKGVYKSPWERESFPAVIQLRPLCGTCTVVQPDHPPSYLLNMVQTFILTRTVAIVGMFVAQISYAAPTPYFGACNIGCFFAEMPDEEPTTTAAAFAASPTPTESDSSVFGGVNKIAEALRGKTSKSEDADVDVFAIIKIPDEDDGGPND
ncbi:hypothetical protein BXZ70DRAFT_533263 [Cristinia sonorae]|uniref:Uncharacterized protein n=1 Tax=Cristinia sonorae TaxID=1940300 RepID=A0A8K0UG59_9AGAR|nr:hypothetical protein BXZ70DRAFT_533263 [Cristinia sonorae]